MVFRRRILPAALTLGVLAALGCPATTGVTVAGSPAPGTPEGSIDGRGGSGEKSITTAWIFQLIEGSVLVPTGLAGGKERLEGLRLDDVEAARATAYRAPGFGVLQATAAPAPAAEVPVWNALVSVRGYDLKTIPELPSQYSTEDGQFYFTNVPSRIAFFIEAQVETKEGKTFQLLGLTRTEDVGKATRVTIDAASTMVARELMRMWQLSGYRISFKDIDPRDFNPLLQRLRKTLKGGFPAGVSFDPAAVSQPEGTWDFTKDQKDSALLALEKLAAREELLSREVDRLYLAVNAAVTNVRDASRNVIKRPPSLLGPAPTPTPKVTGPTPTPKPTKPKKRAIGSIVASTFPATVKFRPLLDRDPDGTAATTTTDATGKFSILLDVGFDGDATYEVNRLEPDGRETPLGSFRLVEEEQTMSTSFTGGGVSTPRPNAPS